MSCMGLGLLPGVAAALPSMALRTTLPASSHRRSEHPMFTDHPGLHAKWKTRLFGSLRMSTWTDVLHGVCHWVLQPSPSITAVLCQRLRRPNSFSADGHMV
jgi:hypothetical protein